MQQSSQRSEALELQLRQHQDALRAQYELLDKSSSVAEEYEHQLRQLRETSIVSGWPLALMTTAPAYYRLHTCVPCLRTAGEG